MKYGCLENVGNVDFSIHEEHKCTIQFLGALDYVEYTVATMFIFLPHYFYKINFIS
jgi:hypothetical protein